MNQFHEDNKSQGLSRRDALKALTAIGGATALSTLPSRWESPIVRVGALPAFAQTSPAQYPFTSEVEGVEFEGASSGDIQYAMPPGWIVVAPSGLSMSSSSSDYPWTGYPWIPCAPWLCIRRDFTLPPVLTPPWTVKIKMKLKIKFKKKKGFGSSNKPVDGIELPCFGTSGVNLKMRFVQKFKIKSSGIDLNFGLPALSTMNIFPIYYSLSFLQPIQLIGGGLLNPDYFLGPCIYGRKVKSSWFKN